MKKYKTTSHSSSHWDNQPVDPILPEEEGDWKLVSSAAVTRNWAGEYTQVFWFWEKLV